MKKALVASILGMAAGVATSYGQGHIIFSNYTSTTYNQVKYAVDPALGALSGQPVTSTTVEVQLFWEDGTAGSFASVPAFIASAHAANTTFISSSFSFNGGGYYADPNDVSLDSATGPITFAVEAWQTTGASGGLTYAASGLRGTSGLWTETAAANANSNGIQPSANPQKSFLVGPPVMTIDIVPEPSILALGGLGTLLLAIRRRK